MKKTCAIMSTFNEQDIVLESVTKLIDGGVDVFLIDNGSTDGTVEQIAHLVGRGVIDIKSVTFTENGKEIYNWAAILKLKEQLSRELDYDWFIHVDADEIRYSPWPETSLREGIDKVDHSGYNLINFKLFNFRLTQDIAGNADYEQAMPLYSGGEHFNQRQIKAWKAHPEIDLATYGGHIAQIPGGRVYPVRFIHKHYPVRSLAHGQRKIIHERKGRFSELEKQRGWHVQYDQLTDVKPEDVFWKPENLTAFNLQNERQALISEACDITCRVLASCDMAPLQAQMTHYLQELFARHKYENEHANQVINVSNQIANLLGSGTLPAISTSSTEAELIRHAVSLMTAMKYINGDAAAYPQLASLQFKTDQEQP